MKYHHGLLFGFSLVVAGACASAPLHSPLLREPIRVETSKVDTIAFLGVELPYAGTSVGGHYDGLASVYQGPNYLTADLKSNFETAMRQFGEDQLRTAGYPVHATSSVFTSIENVSDVRFVLAGKSTYFQVDTYGALAGNRMRVELVVRWELFDRTKGRVTYSTLYRGSATRSSSDSDAGTLAFHESIRSVLADPDFVQAVRTDRKSAPTERGRSTAGTPDWARPLPSATEILEVDASRLSSAVTTRPLERALDATLTLKTSQGTGTAFLISNNGLALTNHHVAGVGGVLEARLRDGRSLPARLVRSSEAADVALVEVDCAPDCPTVLFLRGHQPEPGSDVLAIGSPLGESLSHTITRGIVSGYRLSDSGVTLVQTDAAVNPGNSGGPLCDRESGAIIGMVTSKLVDESLEGLAFAIAAEDALRVVGVRLRVEND